MFYSIARDALDSNRSEGWLFVAKAMGMTPLELEQHLTREDLSFEECMQLMRESHSPELLNYILGQVDLNWGYDEKKHKVKHVMRPQSALMN